MYFDWMNALTGLTKGRLLCFVERGRAGILRATSESEKCLLKCPLPRPPTHTTIAEPVHFWNASENDPRQ